MADVLPSGAVDAGECIATIQRQYTPDEISAYIRSFVAGIANGSDAAADDLADFVANLPREWGHGDESN